LQRDTELTTQSVSYPQRLTERSCNAPLDIKMQWFAYDAATLLFGRLKDIHFVKYPAPVICGDFPMEASGECGKMIKWIKVECMCVDALGI